MSMKDEDIIPISQTLLVNEDIAVSTVDGLPECISVGANYGMSVEEGTKAIIDEVIERLVIVNNLSDDDQIRLIQNNVEDYKLIIKPSDKVKEAYKFLVKL